MEDKVVSYLMADRPAFRDRLNKLLRIPSLAADPNCADSMREAQSFLINRLKEMGLSDARLLEGTGQPAVYASWMGAPGKPTVLVYAHYDVQPADPLDQWRTPPFEPTEVDGRIYARGSSDVKASALIAIETVAGFLAVEGECPVNIKFFLEGEEEIGSPSLRGLVDKYRDLLKSDAILSADGGRASAEVPTINVGARGIARFDFTIKTADKDLHSGRYGGAVRNAIHEIVRMISTLHDSEGQITVPEFVSSADSIPEVELAAAKAFPFDEAGFFKDVGASALGEPGYSTRERLTLRPTIELNGIWGGYAGPGMKTIVPAEASAKITMRLVAGQTPEKAIEIVQNHLKKQCAPGVQLTFSPFEAGAPASYLSAGHPLIAASESILKKITGKSPLPVRLGATVPIAAIFKEMLDTETLLFGYNLPDEDIHAPNEFFRVTSIDEGLTAWPMFLRELGSYKTADFAMAEKK